VTNSQSSLFEADARSILDSLLSESAIYRTSADFQNLLDFVVRLRNFAPFNAMLLQIQKPGLSYAASALDWAERFRRYPKEGVRPLIILWPFGPVALVYDVLDTDGEPLPEDVSSFLSSGPVATSMFPSFIGRLKGKHIQCCWVDAGDNSAGAIRCIAENFDGKGTNAYRVFVNKNHAPAVQFTTLLHELAHLFLGHLGRDKMLNVPDRWGLALAQREIEAESVAYLVSLRNGVTPKSQVYLSSFVQRNQTVDDIDLYQVMRAAGQVEALLGLTRSTKFPKPRPRDDAAFARMVSIEIEGD
jgi:hypothetical protein